MNTDLSYYSKKCNPKVQNKNNPRAKGKQAEAKTARDLHLGNM